MPKFLENSITVKELLAYVISAVTILVSISISYAEYTRKDAVTQVKLEGIIEALKDNTAINARQNDQLERLNILLTEFKVRVEIKR